ncbi:MAG: M23 family metallopeptidase [Chthoniobacterales bacterium]
MRNKWFWLAMVALIATLFAAPTGNVARTRIADGFDFPVGKPDAEGYYKSRGFLRHHPGEDWNGIGGGNTDLRDPVYCIGNGMVVFAKDARMGWGNVVIVRHTYLSRGQLQTVDSFYAHLDRMTVREGQQVLRGQQVGTIGTNRGMYTAHLHFEIRKNLHIGINRSAFRRDLTNYYVPTDFINPNRQLQGGGKSALIAVNTFNEKGIFDGRSSTTQAQTKPAELTQAEKPDKKSSQKPVSRRSSFEVNRFGDIESF